MPGGSEFDPRPLPEGGAFDEFDPRPLPEGGAFDDEAWEIRCDDCVDVRGTWRALSGRSPSGRPVVLVGPYAGSVKQDRLVCGIRSFATPRASFNNLAHTTFPLEEPRTARWHTPAVSVRLLHHARSCFSDVKVCEALRVGPGVVRS